VLRKRAARQVLRSQGSIGELERGKEFADQPYLFVALRSAADGLRGLRKLL